MDSMSKGSLIYSTPRNGLPQRLFSVLFTGLCWFTAGAVVCLAIIGEIALHEGGSSISLWFVLGFIILILVGSPLLMAYVVLNTKFNIYDDGITEPITLFQFFSEEGRFVPFSDVKGYQRFYENGSQIVLHLSESDYVAFSDRRKRVIATLENELRRHGVAHIPCDCPSCGQTIFHYSLQCPKCKSLLIGKDV